MLTGAQDAIAVHTSLLWMSRLIDVTASLRARGYPRSAAGVVTLEIADPVLLDNAGCLSLQWQDGEIRVEPATHAGARLEVGTFASIYTGRLPARDAVRLGLLEGGSERDIAVLEAAFGGLQPWLPDVF